MKKIIILFTVALTFFSNVTAEGAEFKDFVDKIQQIKFQPDVHIETTKIVVLHPMVKDKVTELIHSSSLTWENGNCTKKVESFKQTQGKPVKGETGVGKSFPFKYPTEDLMKFCQNSKVNDWKVASAGLKLDGKKYNGYSFTVLDDGKSKECLVFLNDEEEICALSMGFEKNGIKSEANMKESGTTWYFEKIDSLLALVKKSVVTAEKKSGVPFVKTELVEFR